MENNNTSAFNFRDVADSKGVLSKHSYGVAIDINPIQNPYMKGEKVSPAAGKSYLDRGEIRKGMIIKGDVCYKAFKDRGWTWGGEWKTMKDYQHFQKSIPLN
nr:M15 family metallopeptidase [Anaerosolibacter carboniphilus]